MIYFSELKGKKVLTEDHVPVGILEDVIFLASENANITKLVIRGALKEKLVIPSAYFKKINHEILIAKDYQIATLEENELYVLRNILDKQIIDIKGNKIVRVNDVAIQEKGQLNVIGVDVGLLGILRWLKIEKLINKFLELFHHQITSSFMSWGDIQPLELLNGHVKLKMKEEKLQAIRPEDLAGYLEKTNVHNAKRFLRILDDKKAAKVISNINFNYQTALFKSFKPDQSARFISLLDPDDAVDILLTLSSKRKKEILDQLSEDKKIELYHLLSMSKNPVGNLMTTEYLTVHSEDSVRLTIDMIKKKTTEFSSLTHIYVINKDNQLVGVFDLHELILQNFESSVYKFMVQDIIFAYITTPAEILFKKMLKYRLAAVPVVDQEKHIQGIITLDDISKVIPRYE